MFQLSSLSGLVTASTLDASSSLEDRGLNGRIQIVWSPRVTWLTFNMSIFKSLSVCLHIKPYCKPCCKPYRKRFRVVLKFNFWTTTWHSGESYGVLVLPSLWPSTWPRPRWEAAARTAIAEIVVKCATAGEQLCSWLTLTFALRIGSVSKPIVPL